MRRRLAALLLLAGLCGCRAARRPPDPVEPMPAVSPPPAVLVPPAPPAIELLLEGARRAQRDGDLETSALLLAEALALPDQERGARDSARLDLALLLADPASSLHDPEGAELHLEQLVAESPGTAAAAIGAVLRRLLDDGRAAADDRAAVAATAAELAQALAATRAALDRREQELERIKEILLGDPAP